jgi:hypothetical protein
LTPCRAEEGLGWRWRVQVLAQVIGGSPGTPASPVHAKYQRLQLNLVPVSAAEAVFGTGSDGILG